MQEDWENIVERIGEGKTSQDCFSWATNPHASHNSVMCGMSQKAWDVGVGVVLPSGLKKAEEGNQGF